MELSVYTKIKVTVLSFIISLISLPLISADIDFSIILKSDDGEKRTLNNNEIIPLDNEIQLKIYSKQKGYVDIFYSSKNTKKTSLLTEPFEINVGQLITLPSDDKFLPMSLENGEVSFEFGFSGDNEKSLKQFNLIASNFDPKKVNISESDNFENIKIDVLQASYIENNLETFNNLIKTKNKVDENTTNLKFNKLRGYEDLYQKVAKSTVYIASFLEDESYGEGSGVIINSNQILTNLHVINKSKNILVIPFGGMAEDPSNDIAFNAEVIKIAPDKDLAIISVNTNLKNPITLSKGCELNIGADAHAVGYPEGNYWSYTKGYISQLRKDYEWLYADDSKYKADVIQTQTPINPGNSGGPLVNNEAHLIGINSFKYDAVGINYAVACNELASFIKSPNNFNGWKIDKSSSKQKSNDKSLDGYDCWDYNKDGENDTCSADSDNNGNIDTYLWDEDHDGDYDWISFDSNENSIPELYVLISKSHDDYDHDLYFFDDNEDEETDRIGHDYDNDQNIDEYQDA